ncbi:hypothetical protein TNCT_295461 [Trichonephila clavata]|uniref:Uncharacterized protein n=1 Tax=Trichonephila clavata TaxID=2740835 RepID=A0A8X6M4T4_TRICU|nr:hypothetical protein TNCT_295461 [Trichonephila clavata]
MEFLSTNQILKSFPQQPSKKFKHHMADAILQLKESSDALHNVSKTPNNKQQVDCNILKATMRHTLRRAMQQNIIPSIGKGISAQNKRRRRSSSRRSGKSSRSKGRRRRSSGRSKRRRSSGRSKRRRRSSGKSKRRRSRSKSKRKSSSGSKRRRQSRKHQGHIEGDGC